MDINECIKLLELKENYTNSDLKKNWRILSKKYHPDNKKTGNETKFQNLSNAFEILKNKNNFDNFYSWNSDYYDYYDSDDNLFVGSDTKVKFKISMEDSYWGREKEILVGFKKYKFNIPRGTKTGNSIILKGLGQIGSIPEYNGNLIIEFILEENENFYLSGDDLFFRYKINIYDLLAGCQKDIQIFDNTIKLNIEPPHESEPVYKKSNFGFPLFRKSDSNGNPIKGDLYILFDIQFPNNYTEEQLTLHKKLQQSYEYSKKL